MADNTQNGQDCFPSRERSELLPSPIARCEIASELERIYETLRSSIKQLFETGVKLQQNQGRLSTVFDAIRKKADFSKGTRIDGDLLTFGDVRLMRRRISEGITDGLTSKAGLALDERIRDAIKASFESECARYNRLIGQQLLFPDEPLSINEIPESPSETGPEPEASPHIILRVPSTRVSVDLPAPEPLTPLKPEEVLIASPALIIRYMDGINEQSNGGLEDDVHPIIARLGIPWANFRLWRDEYEVIAIAAKILEASHHDGKVGRLKQGVVKWVMRSVRMECDGDDQKIAQRMEELGLAAHYAYRSRGGETDSGEPKVRAPRKVDPVVDPRWKFLQDAPRRPLPAKMVKVKKTKKERDPRLEDADYQLLLLARRLLKAVETDKPDPWVYAIGKLEASLEEKTETKLA